MSTPVYLLTGVQAAGKSTVAQAAAERLPRGVAVQDVVLSEHLPAMVGAIAARTLHVVVLDPEPEAVAAREGERDKNAYGPQNTRGPQNTDERRDVSPLVAVLREHTPRIGTWLDTSTMAVGETVDVVLTSVPVLR